ncbi:hypothetical protein [Alkalihalobacillus sp. BA299]|uniref:hypothetical protein n=1 Tax=Alkalihalobacillus sp. BA299 TaxID=2815938 RepID=UPI001ADCE00D|nr:hypothetical protein [Alkalihalobacillus sp. BA299]
MSKIGYMFVGALFTLIISFGYVVFADSFNSTESVIDQDKGTVKNNNEAEGISTSSEVETNKDDQEMFEVVNENPVYVLANQNENGQDSSTFSKQDVVHLPSPEEEAKEIPTKELKYMENVVAPSNFLKDIDKLEIEIENDQIEIEIMQERKKKEVKTEVEIELENEKTKLNGEEAEEFVAQLFESVVIESQEDLQLAVKNMLASYGVDIDTVEMEIKVNTKDKEYVFKNQP